MAAILDDLKYALRIQTKGIGFTIVALFSLAFSIAASTTAFSVVNAIMLKPLIYPHADRILIPWRLAPKTLNLGYGEIPWGIAEFHSLESGLKTFASLGAFKPDSFNLTGVGEPALLDGVRASAQFFQVLGVSPTLGRGFLTGKDRSGHESELVLSYELWQERFGGDRGILGRTVDLNGKPHSVVGVMPAGFAFPRGEEMPGSFGFAHRTQLWVPLVPPAVPLPGTPDELALIGRLKDGMTPAQVQAEMKLFAARVEQAIPGTRGWYNSRVTSLTKQVAGDTRTPLLLTLGAITSVLLIACANIASLLLARSLSRGTEFALRAALGAGRGRVVRQLLTESLLLATGGGLLGIVIADLAIDLVKLFGPVNTPRLQEASLDWRVFAFALGTTLVSGILFGLAPALSASSLNLSESLRERSNGAGRSFRIPKLRNALLILEVALALVLVIASGLLAQTFFRLVRVDPGFNAAREFTFELSLPSSKYENNSKIVPLYQHALEHFRAIPGVASAGLAEMVPMDGATDATMIRIPERPVRKNENPFANYTIASPGYFSSVGTPLLRGRDFLDTDTDHSTPVTIINSSMANKFWPGENPIGKQLALGSPAYPPMTIVGVVSNIKHLSLRDEPGPEMYVPFTQRPFPSMLIMHFVLRCKADPGSLIGSVRASLRSLDPDLPIARVTTLEAIVANSIAGQRFSMLLLGAFAATSLLLASCGLYGLISYSVGQRTREVGIRVALGAERGAVIGMFLGQGARLVSVGIVLGLVAAAGVTHAMAGFLYGVQPTDAGTFSCVSLLLIAVALLACYVPARRATRIDPIVALRHD